MFSGDVYPVKYWLVYPIKVGNDLPCVGSLQLLVMKLPQRGSCAIYLGAQDIFRPVLLRPKLAHHFDSLAFLQSDFDPCMNYSDVAAIMVQNFPEEFPKIILNDKNCWRFVVPAVLASDMKQPTQIYWNDYLPGLKEIVIFIIYGMRYQYRWTFLGGWRKVFFFTKKLRDVL